MHVHLGTRNLVLVEIESIEFIYKVGVYLIYKGTSTIHLVETGENGIKIFETIGKRFQSRVSSRYIVFGENFWL